MAIAYRSHSILNNGTGTPITLTKPSGLAAGDMMIAFLCVRGANISALALTDWTLIDNNTSDNLCVTVLAKYATSGDAAATDFTFSGDSVSSQNASGILVAYSGSFSSVSNITVTDNLVNDSDANDDDIASYSSGITPQPNSTLVFFTVGAVTNGNTSSLSGWAITTSNPGTWNERADFANTQNSDVRMGFADASRPEATATGAFSVNYNSTGNLGDSRGILVPLVETANVSSTLTALTMGSTMPNLAFSSDVSATLTPLIVGSVLPTLTATSENGEWTDQSKNAVDDWDNQTKQ